MCVCLQVSHKILVTLFHFSHIILFLSLSSTNRESSKICNDKGVRKGPVFCYIQLFGVLGQKAFFHLLAAIKNPILKVPQYRLCLFYLVALWCALLVSKKNFLINMQPCSLYPAELKGVLIFKLSFEIVALTICI